MKQSNTRITADRLLNKAKNNKFIHRIRVKDRIVNKLKFSCKGISKKKIKAPLTTFRNVLKTQKSPSSLNIGFKLHNNEICTYRQVRNGFTYFYCKRRVLSDGISTGPLDVELCPVKSKRDYEIQIDDYDSELIHLLHEMNDADS